MKPLFVVVIMIAVFLSGSTALAQTDDVELITSPTPDSLLALHVAYNKLFPVYPGYRIQLFMESGNNALTEAEELIIKFNELYPETGTYITFREPYYRVRVGDFRTRPACPHLFLTPVCKPTPVALIMFFRVLCLIIRLSPDLIAFLPDLFIG